MPSLSFPLLLLDRFVSSYSSRQAAPAGTRNAIMMDPTMMQAQMAAPAPSAESADLASRSQLSMPALTHNAQAVEHVRGLMSIFAGAAAGVLGATGIVQGALVFLVCYLLTSVGLLLKMKDISTYLPTKWYAFLFADVANHVLSFLLFWTMGYTLIHIY